MPLRVVIRAPRLRVRAPRFVAEVETPATDASTAPRPARKAPGPDADAERRRRVRRGLLVFLTVGILLAGSAVALFGERGYLDVRTARQERNELRRAVDQKMAELHDLKLQVRRLEADPGAIERLAREQLNYAKPGEIHFLLQPEDAAEEAP